MNSKSTDNKSLTCEIHFRVLIGKDKCVDCNKSVGDIDVINKSSECHCDCHPDDTPCGQCIGRHDDSFKGNESVTFKSSDKISFKDGLKIVKKIKVKLEKSIRSLEETLETVEKIRKKTMKPIEEKTLNDRIYDILFASSTVDGVRIINEDSWPISAILSLLEETTEEIIGKNEKKINYQGYVTHTTESSARNNLRKEQRARAKRLLGVEQSNLL